MACSTIPNLLPPRAKKSRSRPSTQGNLSPQRNLSTQRNLSPQGNLSTQGNLVNVAEADLSPRVMTGPGPVTHDFARIGAKSRGWPGLPWHGEKPSPDCPDLRPHPPAIPSRSFTAILRRPCLPWHGQARISRSSASSPLPIHPLTKDWRISLREDYDAFILDLTPRDQCTAPFS
jgi:hypothetical protein